MDIHRQRKPVVVAEALILSREHAPDEDQPFRWPNPQAWRHLRAEASDGARDVLDDLDVPQDCGKYDDGLQFFERMVVRELLDERPRIVEERFAHRLRFVRSDNHVTWFILHDRSVAEESDSASFRALFLSPVSPCATRYAVIPTSYAGRTDPHALTAPRRRVLCPRPTAPKQRGKHGPDDPGFDAHRVRRGGRDAAFQRQ